MNWLYTKLTILILLGACVATLLYGIIFKFDLYRLPTTHLPVLLVNKQIFWLDDIKAIHQVLVNSYKISPQETFPLIKKVFTEQTIINSLAKQENIKPIPLNDTKVLNDEQELIKAEQLAGDLYGWPLEKFERLIIKPIELRRGVANWYYEKNNSQIKQEILDLKSSLKNINDFNKNTSAKYLGFVELKTLPLNMQLAVLNLKANEISDLVESNEAYHLIYLQSYLVDSGVYEISVITKPKNLFQTWLDEQVKNYKVFSVIK